MNPIISFPSSVLAPIRKYFLHEQQKLLKRKDDLRKEDPFEDEGRVDDNADIGMEAREQWGHQRVEALGKEVDRTLVRIRKALTRIKIGKYGICESCGVMIDTDRLAVNPMADLCMSCQQKQAHTDE